MVSKLLPPFVVLVFECSLPVMTLSQVELQSEFRTTLLKYFKRPVNKSKHMQQWYPALPNTTNCDFCSTNPNQTHQQNKNITWKSLIFTHKHNKPLFLSALVFSAYLF